MLVIGSAALEYHGLLIDRTPADTDRICTFEQFQKWTRENKAVIKHCTPLSDTKFHVVTKDGWNNEFEIAWEGTAARALLDVYGGEGVASVDWLYALKMSHRYLRNSTHFAKTMRDIKLLREHVSPDAQLIIESEWFKQRERETYTYKHPKLDVSKQEFFDGDGVPYVYDHDSIHLTVALKTESYEVDGGYYHTTRPAYTFYMKDGSEVMTSKEKFMGVHEHIRLYGVYEETCVLALERSQIPFTLGKECGPTPRESFMKALEKVCTSITSGWFREYAWENYDKVLDLYKQMGENDYTERFIKNAHLLKPFEGEIK
jgi:hypothetical protein